MNKTPSQNYSLQNLNTLKLPAVADYFAEFSSFSELLDLAGFARSNQLAIKVMGGGSNLLCHAQVKGLVIRSRMEGIQLLERTRGYVRVAVDAGLNWHQWVLASCEYGHGLENLALIPGTVGASPVQNIGAYGVEVDQLIDSVQGYCLSSGQLMTLGREACRFGYRDSVFKRELANDFIITRVVFKLKTAYQPVLDYAPLAAFVEEQGREPDSSELIELVCRIRDERLPRPEQTPNAGSFFKNPVIPAFVAEKLAESHQSLPVYPAKPGHQKLAAGWLIDQCGWKGKQLGHAGMYEKQALVLTTDGQATRADVDALVQRIQQDVMEKFGVLLEPEPVSFG